MITLLFEGDPPCIQCILDCGSFVWKAYDSFWPNSRNNWPLLSAILIKCRDVSRWLEFLAPSEKMQTRKTRKRMKLAKLVEHFVTLFLANPSPSIFFAVTTVWFIRTALAVLFCGNVKIQYVATISAWKSQINSAVMEAKLASQSETYKKKRWNLWFSELSNKYIFYNLYTCVDLYEQ